jgi:prefoldin subunit 5
MIEVGFAPHKKVPEPPRPTDEERMMEIMESMLRPTISRFRPPPESESFNLLFGRVSPGEVEEVTQLPELQLPAKLKSVIQKVDVEISKLTQDITDLLAKNTHIDRLAGHLTRYQDHAERMDRDQLASEIKQLCAQVRRVAKCVSDIRGLRTQAKRLSLRLGGIEILAKDVSAARQIVSEVVEELFQIAGATRRKMRYIQRNGNAVLDALDQVSLKRYPYPCCF